MHVKNILRPMLIGVMHLKRLSTLLLMVEAVLVERRLSLTQLGRSLRLPIQERSGIRRADRCLGNRHLHQERSVIYGSLCQRLIGMKQRPWIIVDWSHVPNTKDHILRATFVAKGRALVLYEEVHPEKKQNNAKVQRAFLATLKQLLPETCLPIIITDAGFHNPWFKDVRQLGWDYVGRIRGSKKYCREGEKDWHYCRHLWPQATVRTKTFGRVRLSRKNPFQTVLYLFREKANTISRHKKRYHKAARENRQAAAEPWLLASSLQHKNAVKQVVNIYRTRMQIEERFRDLKSTQYGFSFQQARTRNTQRIQVLLLIAALASFVAWITGWLGERFNLQGQFQANSIKHRRVLSLFYLGCRIIKRNVPIQLTQKYWQQMIDELAQGWNLCA